MESSTNNIGEPKMKPNFTLLLALFLALGGCSTGYYVQDDAYYSEKHAPSKEAGKVAISSSESKMATTTSSNSLHEYETYSQESQQSVVSGNEKPQAVYSTTETVVEPDGTSYSSTETYFDSEYAQRFRRFNSDFNSSFGYYDGFNTGCFNGYNSFSVGYSPFSPYGWSFGFNYGWPNYYSYSPYWGSYDPYWGWGYDPFWGNSWHYGWGYGRPWGWGGYYSGYYHGFWDGYYYGGIYDYPNNYKPSTLYGHRGTRGSGTTIPGPSGRPSGSGGEKSSYSSPRGDRANGGTSAGTSQNGAIQQGSERGNRNQAVRPTMPERGVQGGNNYSRPTTQQKIGDYREKYQRPASREQRYERPKSYSSPASRQPNSSNEYVRPGTGQRPATSGENKTTVTPNRQGARPLSSPQRVRDNQNVLQPSRSSSSESRGFSSPSRSSSGESRSYTPSNSRSSSNSSGNSSSGSSSSGSSRGSSSGSHSSGGRR